MATDLLEFYKFYIFDMFKIPEIIMASKWRCPFIMGSIAWMYKWEEDKTMPQIHDAQKMTMSQTNQMPAYYNKTS